MHELSLSVDFFLQHTPKGTPPPSPSQKAQAVIMPDLDQGEGPKADLDLCIGPKDAYVVEVKLIIPFSSNFVWYFLLCCGILSIIAMGIVNFQYFTTFGPRFKAWTRVDLQR